MIKAMTRDSKILSSMEDPSAAMQNLQSNVSMTAVKSVAVTIILSYFLIPVIRRCISFVSHMRRIQTAAGAWPLLGHVPLLFKIKSDEKCNDSQALHIMIERMIESSDEIRKNGLFKLFMGPIPLVIVTSAEPASILLKSKTLPKSFIYKYLDMAAVGLANLNGDKWKYHRKLLTPAFDYKIIQDLPAILISNGSSLQAVLQKTAETTGTVDNLGALMSLYALRVLLESAVGLNEETMSDILNKNGANTIEELEATFDESANLLMERMLYPWNYFDCIYKMTSAGKRMQDLLDFMTGLVQQVLQRRKEEIEMQSSQESKKTTFIEILLREHEQRPDTFTQADVDGELRTFLAAGHETTATTLTWFLFYVGHHPHVMQKIQQEIDALYEDKEDEELSLTDLRELKYLEATINESMRLTASVPLFSRTADQDFRVTDDVTIPKHAVLVVYPYFIHRNEKTWHNAQSFDPDRFHLQERHVPHSFIPFSAGHRSCIGQKYAMITMLGLMCGLFRRFNVRSLDRMEDVKGSMNISFRPDRLLRLQIEKRDLASGSNKLGRSESRTV